MWWIVAVIALLVFMAAVWVFLSAADDCKNDY